MNKTELVSEIAQFSKLTKVDSEKALNGFIEAVKTALQKGDDVRLVGFGTFNTSNRKAGKGRNPRTGEEIDIKASTLAKFRAGKDLKDSLNNVKK